PASVNSAIPAERPAISASSAIAPPAPTSAKSGSHQPLVAYPNQKLVTAPRAAPGATPNSPGSARGFRRYPCIAAPAAPSPAPTTTASNARGRRNSARITAALGVLQGTSHTRPASSDNGIATRRSRVRRGRGRARTPPRLEGRGSGVGRSDPSGLAPPQPLPQPGGEGPSGSPPTSPRRGSRSAHRRTAARDRAVRSARLSTRAAPDGSTSARSPRPARLREGRPAPVRAVGRLPAPAPARPSGWQSPYAPVFARPASAPRARCRPRSEEHTSELQ